MDRRGSLRYWRTQEVPHDPTEPLRIVKICEVTGALEQDESRVRDELLHATSVCDRNCIVLGPPYKQRWDLDAREQRGEILVDDLDENRPHGPSFLIVLRRYAVVNGVAQGPARSPYCSGELCPLRHQPLHSR